MSPRGLARSLPLAALLLLALPAVASADTPLLRQAIEGNLEQSVGINSIWVVVCAILVIFMQAGFAFLEIGFSRGKNVGTIVAKILVNFSIAALAFWACGFALAFGIHDAFGIDGLWGTDGFFLADFYGAAGDPDAGIPDGGAQAAFPVMGLSDASIEAKFLFQFAFCAVSLAIVWGAVLERVKFGVYIIYAIVFAALIYPLAAGWVFGGGFLQTGDWLGLGIVGMQDFAGSTAVHLIGATGGLACLLLLGARKGKYGADGKPRAIPGHNMPLFGLGVIILLIGWFGFNPGSTLNALDGRFPEIAVITLIAAAAGCCTSVIVAAWKTKTIDIGMAGNGVIGALVAITAPSGYVELWAAPIIGAIAGIIVPLGIYAIDKKLDDPVGALTAHGICGVWGTISLGFFTFPEYAAYNAFGDPEGGLFYSGSFAQLVAQVVGVLIIFVFVFAMSYGTFWVIKKTYGLRVTEEEEDAGLDISEHGMYGYPEQFIPQPELVGYASAPGSRDVPSPQLSPKEVTS